MTLKRDSYSKYVALTNNAFIPACLYILHFSSILVDLLERQECSPDLFRTLQFADFPVTKLVGNYSKRQRSYIRSETKNTH